MPRLRPARSRRARATQRERRASELKSQFVALASHELRAPVAGIHGVTTTTLRERGDDFLPARDLRRGGGWAMLKMMDEPIDDHGHHHHRDCGPGPAEPSRP